MNIFTGGSRAECPSRICLFILLETGVHDKEKSLQKVCYSTGDESLGDLICSSDLFSCCGPRECLSVLEFGIIGQIRGTNVRGEKIFVIHCKEFMVERKKAAGILLQSYG